MKAQDLMAKAVQAAISAKVLLDTGDADGACNRAYYAMFDAARAALLASGALVDLDIGRTHSGPDIGLQPVSGQDWSRTG